MEFRRVLFRSGGDSADRMVLAVHGSLLQSGKYLADRHRCGVRAPRPECSDIDRVVGYPYFQALQILGNMNGSLPRGNSAEPAFKHPQRSTADFLVHVFVEPLAHRAVGDPKSMLAIGETQG